MIAYICQYYTWNLKQIFNPPVLQESTTAVRWRWGHLAGMQGRLWEGTLRKCRSFWAGQGVEGEPSTHVRRVKRNMGWRHRSPWGGKWHFPPQSEPPMPPGAGPPVCLFTFRPFFCCAAPFLLVIFDIKAFIYHPHCKYIFQNYEFIFLFCLWHLPGLPQELDGKESVCNSVDTRDLGSIPGSGRSPWRRKWQPTPVFLPGKSHGQRSLVDYSPWGCKEPDTT